MARQIFVLIFAILLIAVPLVNCTAPTEPTLYPDLVPANPGGWPNFCERDNEGALVIHVQNKGDGYALCSTALIEFPGSGISMPLQVPAIPPGETYELDHIRSGQPCFPDLDCFFRITVDYDSICEESDETNNSVEGKCTG